MNSTDTSQHSILVKLYLEAASDLLVVYGAKTNFVGAPASKTLGRNKSSYVSVLGATGEGIALSSVLKVERNLLTGMYPLVDWAEIPRVDRAEISRGYLEDWRRELNNQLVGRMKNKLSRYGVTLTMGLPLPLTGTADGAAGAPDLPVTEHSFRTGDGEMALTLATLVSEDLELQERESSTECEANLLETAIALF